MENNRFVLKALKYLYDELVRLIDYNYTTQEAYYLMESLFEFEAYKVYDEEIYTENPEVFEKVFAIFLSWNTGDELQDIRH